MLESAQGRGEEFSRVEATPVGFGKWDLLFYLLPFLAVGFLWFRGISRRRSRMKKIAGRIEPRSGQECSGASRGMRFQKLTSEPEGTKE